MVFDDRKYTEDSLIKQLALVELHSKDGSALDAGCSCIESKHLFIIEGLAEEGKGFAMSEKEKKFYEELGKLAREIRKKMEVEDYTLPSNPARHFLPHGLTTHEASSISIQKKLSRCIKSAELKCCGAYTSDYSKCSCNPVAVCRASIEG